MNISENREKERKEVKEDSKDEYWTRYVLDSETGKTEKLKIRIEEAMKDIDELFE